MPVFAQATLDALGVGPGTQSIANGISANGNGLVLGIDLSVGQNTAGYWSMGTGMTSLGTLGGSISEGLGISADGLTVLGASFTAGDAEIRSFIWNNGVVTDLGTLGGYDTIGLLISADGSVVSGYASTAGGEVHAFRWQNGVLTDLGSNGFTTYADSMTPDGNIIAGSQYVTGSSVGTIFRWENGVMTDLGNLGGNAGSNAAAISYDGSVIAGFSSVAGSNDLHAFRWENGVMADLGALGTNRSLAKLISSDGSVIAGDFGDVSVQHAFRWESGVMTDLGTLGGLTSSVSSMSADGAVITGASTLADTSYAAFVWTSDDGMRSIDQVAIDAGIDLTGWMIYAGNYVFVSADGEYLTGTALVNGAAQAYILSIPTAAIITADELAEALKPTTVPATQGQSSINQGVGQSLLVARNSLSTYFPKVDARVIENQRTKGMNLSAIDDRSLADISPAAGGADKFSRRKALYATGSFGAGQNDNFSNYGANGTTGILVEVSENFALGAGVLGSHTEQETHLNGESRATATGGSVVAAFEPSSGLRLYGTAAIAALDVSTDRNYMNGAALDGSSGDTGGIGYGVAVRAGYEFEMYEGASVMPYGEVQYAYTKLDGYTETGGGFPAVIEDQTDDLAVSRLGVEISHDVTENLTMRGRTAWGHRYTSGGSVIATSASITQAIPGNPGERNWAEAGLGMNFKFSEKLTFSGDIAGRMGETAEPAVSVTAGLVWAWN